MKKMLFPLEKLAISFFFLEMLLNLDRITYSAFALVLMVLSIKYEGARIYTPLLFLIFILEFLNLLAIQAVLIILVGFVAMLFKVYDINVPIKGPYLMGHRYTHLPIDGSNLLVSVFYPTLTKGSKSEWIVKK
jgi:hypothetical protein